MPPFACIGFITLGNYLLEYVPSGADDCWCIPCLASMWSLQGLMCCSLCDWWSVCADPQLLHVPVGTLAVDAPLAACKRTVWASLGPTHRYFIDVWQQGQWANAPAGDEAAVSWMKFICMEDWQWVKLDSTESSSRLPFSELERGGHPKMSVCDELFMCVIWKICLACWRWILVWSVCVSRHISVIRLECCKMHCSYVWKSSHGLLSLYMFHGTFSCQVLWCR